MTGQPESKHVSIDQHLLKSITCFSSNKMFLCLCVAEEEEAGEQRCRLAQSLQSGH